MKATTLALAVVGFALAAQAPPPPPDKYQPSELMRIAVEQLVKMQEEDGLWPYEGVYRVNRQIPVGYRIGGTAVVATALLFAAPENPDARTAVDKACEFILKELNDPLMAPSTQDSYDVRIWGHAYALEFFCHLRAGKRVGKHAKDIDDWITKLIEILVREEIPGGGWNYANHNRHASFVTAPVTQALLFARGQGEKVPDDVFARARSVLEQSRAENGAYVYAGTLRPQADSRPPGSAARSATCEATLYLMNASTPKSLQAAVDAFATHWEELDKRRKKPGTHEGEYGIAPYYFYYGHRYAAQAIELLPPEQRPAERERLLQLMLRTRDDDGTWNDRIFPRSRNYGTAAIVLALLADKTPTPPRWEGK